MSSEGRRSDGMSAEGDARSYELDISSEPDPELLCLCAYLSGEGKSVEGVFCLDVSLLRCTRSLLEPCWELLADPGCGFNDDPDGAKEVRGREEEEGPSAEGWAEGGGLGIHAVEVGGLSQHVTKRFSSGDFSGCSLAAPDQTKSGSERDARGRWCLA